MITEQHHYNFQVQLLITLITLFVLAFVIFFAITFISRYKKIKKTELKTSYHKIVDEILFKILFDENTTVESASDYFKAEVIPTKLIKKISIKSINALHRNYSGELKKKLEEFYIKSDLVNYSLKKIDSLNWAKIVESIRDLSNLNYQPSFDKIYEKLNHSKEIVQKEAFIGVILLKGLDQLIQLKDSKIYLDDWTQSNILFVVKRNQMTIPDNIEALLKSKNETIVLLGARLIEYFQLRQYTPLLEQTISNNKLTESKVKLHVILLRLQHIHF
ncbi:hypothetical protein [Flavobacterium sp. H122]|uniref:hypothetical protein n=1 Tax=Flavobacterium sp. H122 TaxID=2529860 RepID=UPI0010A9FA23|nr:hypothetical protein [Flavobacterium sp. H122]